MTSPKQTYIVACACGRWRVNALAGLTPEAVIDVRDAATELLNAMECDGLLPTTQGEEYPAVTELRQALSRLRGELWNEANGDNG